MLVYQRVQIVNIFQFTLSNSKISSILEPALIATSGRYVNSKPQADLWRSRMVGPSELAKSPSESLSVLPRIKHSVKMSPGINQKQPKLGGSFLTLGGPTQYKATASDPGTSKTSCFVAKSTKARSTWPTCFARSISSLLPWFSHGFWSVFPTGNWEETYCQSGT